jgi:spore coat protein A
MSARHSPAPGRASVVVSSLAALLAAAVSLGVLAPPMLAQEPALLDAHTQPKFVNPLPNPLAPSFAFLPDGMIGGQAFYSIGIYQFEQSLGLRDPGTGQPLITTVWGYGKEAASATYPGRTLHMQRDVPASVLWDNRLIDAQGAPLPHLLPVDTTVHWAMPMDPPYPQSGVPVVTHVHGGHSESTSDGLPESWFTPGFAQVGPGWVKDVYHYDNDQEAASLWYHDHALGITRLNVYAGLAGLYILRDTWDTGAPGNPVGLPAFPYEVALVIQDRMFTADGQLFYPSEPDEDEEGAPTPSVLPEFFGDFILVNGQAWPVLDVEPREYRLRFYNGSDSRFYRLRLVRKGGAGLVAAAAMGSGPVIHQIGTDDGLLDAPVALSQLTLGTGERADTVVDFAPYAGQTLILRNIAKSPFPAGEVVAPDTTGQIMAFRVTLPLDPGQPQTTLPATLRPSPVPTLVQAGPTRQLILFESTDEFGRLLPMLGTVAGGKQAWDDPTTETPLLGDTEVWEIYNLTPDAHPIHLHLVAFQLLDRQRFKADVDPLTGAPSSIQLIGQSKPAPASERGWKDTVKMMPGEVTRVIAKFDRAGEYVWHCHILSHEDHDMMRRFEVHE